MPQPEWFVETRSDHVVVENGGMRSVYRRASPGASRIRIEPLTGEACEGTFYGDKDHGTGSFRVAVRRPGCGRSRWYPAHHIDRVWLELLAD